jgi:two-component system response regulator AtoC
MQRYSWPGNVRELRNIVQRSLVLADGDTIEPGDLPDHLTGNTHSGPVPIVIDEENLSIKYWSRELEKHLIERALEETGGNRTHAAEKLEISHRTLLYKLKDYFPDGLD